MNTEVIRCPACGGQLEINGNDEIIVCRFCQNSIRINRTKQSDGSSKTVIYEKIKKIPLGSAILPEGCSTIGMIVPNLSTYTYPVTITASAFNSRGTVVTFFTGEAYLDKSKCPIYDSMYANEVNRISRIAFRNFIEAEAYVDNYVVDYVKGARATSARFIENRKMPIDGFDSEVCMELYKNEIEYEKHRTGTLDAIDLGYYLKPVCRVYEMIQNNRAYRIVVATVVKGFKYTSNQLKQSNMMLNMNPMNMFQGLSSLFGGRNANIKQQTQNAPVTGFGQMGDSEIIEWKSDGLFFMQSPAENFDRDYDELYRRFCSTFRVDRNILNSYYQIQDQIRAEVARYTQQNIQMQQQQFQAFQQANAARQAAFDRANQAWWDRNNSSYAAYRARQDSYARGESSADRMSRLQSEAIRGVNTYVRDDGSEVEVSVAYDHAYTNNLHDTYATNSSFEPGGNWTEMHRK